MLVPVPMYGGDTMLWKEKERSRIRAVKMDNLRGLLDIRRMDKVPNAWIRELYRMKKDLHPMDFPSQNPTIYFYHEPFPY